MKRFSIIFGLIPWWVFSSLYEPSYKAVAFSSSIAIILTFILNYNELKKKFVLPRGSIVCFILFAVNYYLDVFPQWKIHPAMLINAALSSIIWISLLLGKPFTLQYAKEMVKKTYWKNPLFIRINWYLSFMWAIMLTIASIPSIILPEDIYLKSWLWNYGFTLFSILTALYLNKIMPSIIIGRNFWQKVKNLPHVSSTYLKGGYAPVYDELNLNDLPVDGVIPQELDGVYLRNGANPYFAPYTYTYPIDGDGMIHQISLTNGKASYKNVFIRTKGLVAELKAGKALYAGIGLAIPPDPRLAGDEEFKNTASINVVKWQDKILALYESTTAYLLDSDLNTLGEWQPVKSQDKFKVNAHFRVDHKTGQTYMCTYDISDNFLQFYEFNSSKELVNTIVVPKDIPTMIHDFVITENHIITFDAPAIFNIIDNDGSRPFFSYNQEMPLNIILVNRHDYSIKFIRDIPSFFVYHFVNAYENDQKIIIDFVCHYSLKLNPDLNKPEGHPPTLYRGEIDLTSYSYSHKQLLDNKLLLEFPAYNLYKTGQSYQYCYLLAKDIKNELGFNSVLKYDFVNHTHQIIVLDERYEIDEITFIPNGDKEDSGYLIFFSYDKTTDKSDFIILNAMNPEEEIARIKLPVRVPHGLHGSWNPNQA